MSEWLIPELLNHSIDAALVEARQANKALSTMTVKIDATTPAAHHTGSASAGPVHVKAMSACERRARLAAPETLVGQVRDLESITAQ
jgi:hypothetical protein